tara:strand:- start:2158 stop:3309 length:1152 start_codon:yes stop_codon:yes gene_type:complete
MSDFETIIDFGSKNLKLGVFNKESKNIYSSEQKIIVSVEKSLNNLVKDAEKFLSAHIENVVVLYDSSKFYSLDISIKKVFDNEMSIKKVYDNLIEEAHFFISQNNFQDQIIHSVINSIVVDGRKNLNQITEDIKIKSLVLEIKFICLSKILIDNISIIFKKNNLKILNLYCSSYVKSINYKNKFNKKDYIIFLDIGYERTSGLIFKDYKFEFFKSIPLGGNSITKDISKVLKLNIDYSEDLKIKFNKEENNISFNKVDPNSINPYSEVLEKNISIDLLKQVIEARVDEIIKLVMFESNYFKNLNSLEKPKLIIIGGGSQLLYNNFTLNIKKLVSELKIFNDKDSNVCEAGFNYHQTDESFLTKTKNKVKKVGIFESFFNLFSK